MDKNSGNLLKRKGRFLLIALFKITELFPQKEAEYLKNQIRIYSVSMLTDITHLIDCLESNQFCPSCHHILDQLERLKEFVQNAHHLFFIEDKISFQIQQIIHDLVHLLSRSDENRNKPIRDYQDYKVCHYHI